MQCTWKMEKASTEVKVRWMGLLVPGLLVNSRRHRPFSSRAAVGACHPMKVIFALAGDTQGVKGDLALNPANLRGVLPQQRAVATLL